MFPMKMVSARLADRNVRARRLRDDYEDDEDDEAASVDVVSDGEAAAPGDAGSKLGEGGGLDSAGGEVLPQGEEEVEEYISNVSFGALKEAHDQLARKRKRGSETNVEQVEKLDALRSRLQEIRASKNRKAVSAAPKPSRTQAGSANVFATNNPEDVESDSGSAPSEVEGTKSRTSKHAPMSQSTRYQVTRKRTVIDVPKRISRDPRFDAFNQQPVPAGNSSKAYSFLRDYEKSEIAELKSALKQAKSEEDQETLRRKIVSMENRVKTDVAKEREQEVLRQHRREEKQRVEQGKKPFFLKRKEVKDRAMVKKFESMKGKDREKLLERRRRKDDQKEKKRMPEARRVV